jgi:hypothetical protein
MTIELLVTHHVSSDDLRDPDDIDMHDWERHGVPKEYFSALPEDIDPVKAYGEVGTLDCNWHARNSFEFNRMPTSPEEATKAIITYLK